MNTSEDSESIYMTASKASRKFGISHLVLQKWHKKGFITSFKTTDTRTAGRYYKQSEIEDYINKLKQRETKENDKSETHR